MIDLHRLREQFTDFNTYQAQEQARRVHRLERAVQALAECGPEWEALRQRVLDARPPWLVAGLREAPDARYPRTERPTPMTVVATDGSQIYPDRHVEPTCYLLNISRIAFQYGTLERPLMEAVPRFRYSKDQLRNHFDEVIESTTAEVVSALRDEFELEQLLDVARAVRIDGRPILAVADGTLIRWMLRRMQDRELEQKLIDGYTAILAEFQADHIPLCSYISMPRNTELVNLLRVYNGECDEPPPPETDSLEGLTDRWILGRTLEPGERSAVFESGSHIQREYGARDRICYFYVCVQTPGGMEIGRVEVPMWVADDAELLDLIHASILSECEKGNGYPMILSEAHERAVIRARERELFYDMIEREMLNAGLPHSGSRKQASKRRPMV